MDLTISKVSYTPQVCSFKGEPEAVPATQQIKDGDRKLGATLVCLATLGAGALAAVCAFKRGKAAGLKEGKAVVTQAGEAVSAGASKANEAVKPVVEKIRIKSREVRGIKQIDFNKPDGTNVAATQITERLEFSNGRSKLVETVYDSNVEILRKRIVPKKSGIDYTVKEIVEENGQKITKKYNYKNGKVHSTDICTFNPQTGVVKIVRKNAQNEVFYTVQKTGDKFGPRLTRGAVDFELQYIDDGSRVTYDIEEAKEIIKRLNLPFEI